MADGGMSDQPDGVRHEATPSPSLNSGLKTVVNSTSATVPKVFQIGLCGVVEADLELFCNS